MASMNVSAGSQLPAAWPWPDVLDAVVAAQGSQRVVFENERTRVLEVMIGVGQREPIHTHRWRASCWSTGRLASATTPGTRSPTPHLSSPRLIQKPARGSVGSTPKVRISGDMDEHVYRAFRIEFKQI
jgi:hypothetical protein